MVIKSYSYTDRGGREDNQDCVVIEKNADRGVFVVADGVGGRKGGREASACVAASFLEGWYTLTNSQTGDDAEESCSTANAIADDTADSGEALKYTTGDASLNDVDIEQWLAEQVEKAHERILAMQTGAEHMRSTVVALAIDKDRASWVNTGDSRLYYIHEGRIARITEDHSYAYVKYKQGEITRAEINTDPDQSQLVRVLGGEKFTPDTYSTTIRSGDAFMLCSDGVWEYLYDDEILVDRLKADTARDWLELLLLRVISRVKPGNDNLSILTVMVSDSYTS